MQSGSYFCKILIKLKFSGQVFKKKSSNIEYPSNGSRVFPLGQTDRSTDGRADMTKLIVAFRNFANAPKMDPSQDITWT